MTIAEALTQARQTLATLSDAPALDAQWLLLHALHQSEPAWLHTHGDTELTPTQHAHFMALVTQRASGKPLAYIVGSAEFYGRPFLVTPAVLIPRPVTEELVEAALKTIAELESKHDRPLIIADIGTGSGCIAVTLALETTREQVKEIYATDISEAALKVAQKNAEHYQVTDRVSFELGSLLEPLQDKKVDLIVSNPPYIPSAELAKAGRNPETTGLTHEPSIALDGGPDGQQYLKPLIASGLPLVAETTGGVIRQYNL